MFSAIDKCFVRVSTTIRTQLVLIYANLPKIRYFRYTAVMAPVTDTGIRTESVVCNFSFNLIPNLSLYDVWFGFCKKIMPIFKICKLGENLPVTSDPTSIFGFSDPKTFRNIIRYTCFTSGDAKAFFLP